MKAKPEYVEDTDAFTRFRGAMQKVIAVLPTCGSSMRQRAAYSSEWI
ncbi:MAG: hypothetical protein ABI806_15880 [Candidatus Solibacter sp.]